MQKSKSWLKSLLIVVMAVMLVFSLVACNKGGNNGDDSPVEESSADYFNALWSATKSIGTTEIADNADLSVSFGFELSVNTLDEKEDEIYHQIDLGFDVHAVIGRTAATANNTAVKIRLYDPTDANYEEICTIYAFASDLDNLYMDFAGKNIKLPHNLESLIWNEILGNEGDLGNGIVDGLNSGIITIGGEKKSINDIINMFTEDFGSDWSLNSLIDRVLNIFNLNEEKIVSLIDGNALIANAVHSILGVNNTSELFTNGKLDLLKILSSDNIGQILGITAVKQKVGDSIIHTADLNGLVSTVLGFNDALGEIRNMLYAEKIEDGGGVSLSFTEKDGAIEDFTIYAQLFGLRTQIPYENGEEQIFIPEISVKITEFGIEAFASDKSNGVALKAGKTYSDSIAFDETVELAASGIKILALEDEKNDINLNGKIIINAKGQLDIVNTSDSSVANKTQANLSVQLVNGNAAPVTIAELSYANGKIVGKVADGIDLGILGEDYAGKKGFVYDLGDDFNVADLVQGYIRNIADAIINGGNNQGGNEGEGELSATTLSLSEKVKGIVEVILDIVTTPDNHLHISTPNILATIVQFKESINPGDKAIASNPHPENIKWTTENRIEAIVNSLLNPPLPETDMDGCIDIIKGQLDLITGEEGDYELNEVIDTCKDAVLRMLYIVAQNVRIEGVPTEDLDASDYAEFKKNGDEDIVDEDTELMIYINNIKAVLAAQITIDGDLQGGIHASIIINIADATLSASSSFTLVENATFTDLYESYEKDSDKDAWVYINANEEA